MVRNLRRCLRIIRNIDTLPSTILPNGDTAENTAHFYVLRGNKKRNMQKRKKPDEFRDSQVSTESHQEENKRNESFYSPGSKSSSKTNRGKKPRRT